MKVIPVLALESQREGSNVPSVWLLKKASGQATSCGPLPCVSFSALIAFVE